MIRTEGKITPAFIAGFLEGDGFFRRYTEQNGGKWPQVGLTNTNLKILREMEKVLGRGSIYKSDKTYRLMYHGASNVKRVLVILQNNYFSRHRKQQLKPILKQLDFAFKFNDNLSWEWIRGFIFAEGCKTTMRVPAKNSDNVYKYVNYVVSQKDKKILDIIKEKLGGVGICTKIYYGKSSDCYNLYVRKSGDVKKFETLFRAVA